MTVTPVWKLTLVIEPLGDGAFDSSSSLSQVLDPAVLSSSLGLGKLEVIPQGDIGKKPFCRLEATSQGSSQDW